MKNIVILTAVSILFLSSTASSDESVNGYYRRDGTYVQPHMRSSPNSNTMDNWSTRGNTNPYTGTTGSNSYNQYQPSSIYNNYNGQQSTYGGYGYRSK